MEFSSLIFFSDIIAFISGCQAAHAIDTRKTSSCLLSLKLGALVRRATVPDILAFAFSNLDANVSTTRANHHTYLAGSGVSHTSQFFSMTSGFFRRNVSDSI